MVEFDGAGHFIPTYFGNQTKKQALKSLKDQQERDKIKNNFCKENNIHLLRLSNKSTICSELKSFLFNTFNLITEIP